MVVALVVCAPAAAKFRISVAAGDTTRAVGQRVTVVVRSEDRLDFNLRLIAVAPGKDVFAVIATAPDRKVEASETPHLLVVWLTTLHARQNQARSGVDRGTARLERTAARPLLLRPVR